MKDPLFGEEGYVDNVQAPLKQSIVNPSNDLGSNEPGLDDA